MQRHEALRTHFAWVEGEPIQVIELRGAVSVEVEYLRAEGAEREALIRQRAAQQAAGPFDLAISGPLLRVRVLEVEPQEYVLLLCMHHIVSDGWSMGDPPARAISFVRGLYRRKGGGTQIVAGAVRRFCRMAAWMAQLGSTEHGLISGNSCRARPGCWNCQPTIGGLPRRQVRVALFALGIDGDALAGIKRMSRQTAPLSS